MPEIQENTSEYIPIGEREVNGILKDLESAGVERATLKKLWTAYLEDIPGMPKEISLKDSVESREKIILWLCARRKAIESSNSDEMNLITQKLFSRKENPNKVKIESETKKLRENEGLSGSTVESLFLLCARYKNNQEQAMEEYLSASEQDRRVIDKNLLQSTIAESGRKMEESGVTFTRVDLSLSESVKDTVRIILKRKGIVLDQVPVAFSQRYTEIPTIVFLFNPSSKSVQHEINHIIYPGLKVGDWGGGIDESLTDILAIMETSVEKGIVNKLLSKVGSEESRIKSQTSYDSEVAVFFELVNQFPQLRDAFINRYKQNTSTNSNELMKVLLNELGINGMLNLYRIVPQNKRKEGSYLATSFLETFRSWKKGLNRENPRS